MAENRGPQGPELTARREEQRESYVPKPLDLSEYKTRKLYIDAMLTDAGWTEGKDWLQRGGAARYAQQERGGLCRLCAL